MTAAPEWHDIGFHPTPAELVNTIAPVLERAAGGLGGRRRLRVLDMCAGDGRLGQAVTDWARSKRLSVSLTYIESNPGRAATLRECFPKARVIQGDALGWSTRAHFDVVVMNPPYGALNVADAARLKLEWEHVVAGGRNLYGLCILRGLRFCAARGLLIAIAPFTWLRATSWSQFRSTIARQCDRIAVLAHRDRHLFPGVSQDVGVQLFRVGGSVTHAELQYAGEAASEVPLGQSATRNARVRVGSVVWNREREHLCDSCPASIPVLYGGNIREGKVDFTIPAYAGRQHIKGSRASELSQVTGPAIVLRRTLRGRPGQWIVDAARVSKGAALLAENHVLWIELSDEADTDETLHRVVEAVSSHHQASGTPNLSAQEVGLALRDLLQP